MTSIGGPGGIDGPRGPGGPDRSPESPGTDDAAVDAPGGAHATAAAAATGRTGQTADTAPSAPTTGPEVPAVIDALAADLAAGRLTPREAIDRLLQATAGPELGATERAELRELLGDLIASDPHLGSLIGRI